MAKFPKVAALRRAKNDLQPGALRREVIKQSILIPSAHNE